VEAPSTFDTWWKLPWPIPSNGLARIIPSLAVRRGHKSQPTAAGSPADGQHRNHGTVADPGVGLRTEDDHGDASAILVKREWRLARDLYVFRRFEPLW
jgi:hypothetical protein